MTDLFLGVDAGNSKTVAVVADPHGRILGWGRAGLGDIYGAGDPELAVDAVAAAVGAALTTVAMDGRVAAAAFRLAGVDWPEDEEYWHDAVRRRFADFGAWSVKNDGFALLRCGDRRGIGVATNVGTGAAMAGRGVSGDEFVVSWWFQHYLGGAGLGHDAFRAIMLSELGMADATTLTASLCTFFGVPDTAELLHTFTKREDALGHHAKAKAARLVLDAARSGDEVAVEIVARHARNLASYVTLTASRVGFDPAGDAVPVVLGGSVLAAPDSILRAHLIAELAIAVPCALVSESRHASPVHGALLDAIAEGGIALTPELQRAVLEQHLPEGLVAT